MVIHREEVRNLCVRGMIRESEAAASWTEKEPITLRKREVRSLWFLLEFFLGAMVVVAKGHSSYAIQDTALIVSFQGSRGKMTGVVIRACAKSYNTEVMSFSAFVQ